jgi:hypothetical protein
VVIHGVIWSGFSRTCFSGTIAAQGGPPAASSQTANRLGRGAPSTRISPTWQRSRPGATRNLRKSDRSEYILEAIGCGCAFIDYDKKEQGCTPSPVGMKTGSKKKE